MSRPPDYISFPELLKAIEVVRRGLSASGWPEKDMMADAFENLASELKKMARPDER